MDKDPIVVIAARAEERSRQTTYVPSKGYSQFPDREGLANAS